MHEIQHKIMSKNSSTKRKLTFETVMKEIHPLGLEKTSKLKKTLLIALLVYLNSQESIGAKSKSDMNNTKKCFKISKLFIEGKEVPCQWFLKKIQFECRKKTHFLVQF